MGVIRLFNKVFDLRFNTEASKGGLSKQKKTFVSENAHSMINIENF